MSAKKSLSEFMGGVTVFGELTLLREVEPWRKGKEVKRRALFRCACGNEKEIDLNNVRKGMSKTCGMHSKKGIPLTHGMTRTRVYKIWCGMKKRCQEGREDQFPDHAGRGIRVCQEWIDSFESFYAYMGDPEDWESIDRWPNNNGNYEPGNCRWATPNQQANNRRSTSMHKVNDIDISLADFAAEMGMRYQAVYHGVITKGKGLDGLIAEMQEKLSKYIEKE